MAEFSVKIIVVFIAIAAAICLSACGGGPSYADKCQAQGGQVVQDGSDVEMIPIITYVNNVPITNYIYSTVYHSHCVVNGQTVSHHDSE